MKTALSPTLVYQGGKAQLCPMRGAYFAISAAVIRISQLNLYRLYKPYTYIYDTVSAQPEWL